ncbi:MAG: mycofactocin biosynthesis peptidyl-dipeptidase MftE [Actinomycetes bacterium]
MPNSPTWPEISRNECLVIPVGSFEQHGPHLPLDTDTQIASHLCEQAISRIDNVVVAPPLSITASGEHSGFPGTLSIGNNAFTTVIVELVRSCDWATGVILVHGHGGNFEAVQQATAVLNSEHRNIASWWPHIPGADAHAGHTETSLMLAINPNLVRIEKLDVGNVQTMIEIQRDLQTHGVRAVSANGILGDARSATAEHGIELLAKLSENLHTFILSAQQQWSRS